MATQRQIAANRRNAQRSTGPKTPAGKARSSKNVLTHGFTARQLVLSIEDAAAFEQLKQSLFDELQPSTPTQVLLTERIVAAAWRIARLRSATTNVLERDIQYKRERTEEYQDDLTLLSRALCGEIDYFDRLARYEARLDRTIAKALAQLRELRPRHPQSPPPTPSIQTPSPEIGFVFANSCDPSPALDPSEPLKSPAHPADNPDGR